MKFLMIAIFLFLSFLGFSQSIVNRLSSAINLLQKDEQFTHASISMYVVDSKTGTVVFEKNPQLGMAPASTLKIITSASAFELLGSTFFYTSQLGYTGSITGNTLNGNIHFIASGDPSLGSWRWKTTAVETIMYKIITTFKEKNILIINGDLIINDSKWETQGTPRGWIWEDVGNYFGAGGRALNWHENQYDVFLKPGKVAGDSVTVIKTVPVLPKVKFINELKTGKEGSGDNSIIYLPENATSAYLRGTIPASNTPFVIKGSVPNICDLFFNTLQDNLVKNNIVFNGKVVRASHTFLDKKLNDKPIILANIVSPSLDSINYWFLQKSINLFGEAFVKTIAFEKNGFGSTDSGLVIMRNFWSARGVQKSALKIIDGSGLSPANRVTAYSLVTVLQYAIKQYWFNSFYKALPEINGIKMKDGYISGVRSYTGYIKSKSGTQYTFAFIVNNFDGSPATVKEKMWKLLDILK